MAQRQASTRSPPQTLDSLTRAASPGPGLRGLYVMYYNINTCPECTCYYGTLKFPSKAGALDSRNLAFLAATA